MHAAARLQPAQQNAEAAAGWQALLSSLRAEKRALSWPEKVKHSCRAVDLVKQNAGQNLCGSTRIGATCRGILLLGKVRKSPAQNDSY